MVDEKKCTGRCELCNPNQRSYCAAQKSYYMEQDIAEIKRLLAGKESEITTIVTKEEIEIEEDA